MSKPVRIKDIAEKAGVSAGTVDRVLHKRGEVNEKTKEKILSIAKELNYKPNIAAQLLKNSNRFKIAVFLPQPKHEGAFWSKHPQGIDKAINAAHPYDVEVKYFKFKMQDELDFASNADSIIKYKPHGVVLAPLLKLQSHNLCKSLDDLSIPYVFVDTNIPDTNCLSYVGEDAYKSGRVAACLLDTIAPVDKDILIINIAKNLGNTHHLNRRNKGIMNYFLEDGSNKGLKINIDIPEDKDSVIKQYLDGVFENNRTIGAIVVSSSRTSAVAEYLINRGMQKTLVGYEAIDKNIKHLKSGNISFLVSQRPIEQAEKALTSLINFLTTKERAECINYQAIDILNRENI